MADAPNIHQLEALQRDGDLPQIRRADDEVGTFRSEDGEFPGIKLNSGTFIELDEEDFGAYGQRVEIDGDEGWEPIHLWWQRRRKREREEHEALMVRRARANATAKPRLVPIDLTKGYREAGTTKRRHPDIEEGPTYMAKIGGRTYIGTFAEVRDGFWSFRDGYGASGSHQFDPPGTNYSSWEGLWRLEMPEQREVEVHEVEGITYTITRTPNGSVIDTPCQCYGHPQRTHSTPNCPWLAKRGKGES